jgi:hypothetical protein
MSSRQVEIQNCNSDWEAGTAESIKESSAGRHIFKSGDHMDEITQNSVK